MLHSHTSPYVMVIVKSNDSSSNSKMAMVWTLGILKYPTFDSIMSLCLGFKACNSHLNAFMTFVAPSIMMIHCSSVVCLLLLPHLALHISSTLPSIVFVPFLMVQAVSHFQIQPFMMVIVKSIYSSSNSMMVMVQTFNIRHSQISTFDSIMSVCLSFKVCNSHVNAVMTWWRLMSSMT